MLDKMIKVCEDNGWKVDGYEGGNGKYYEIGNYSPAGENFFLTINAENATEFAEGIRIYAAEFDIDTHIELWVDARRAGVSGVPSTRELVKDAEAIDGMLKQLAEAVTEVENEGMCNISV